MEEKGVTCGTTSCGDPIDDQYWNTRWEKQEIGWDIGYASPAITRYIDQYINKDDAVLIPGCGNAYEAEYLISKGFTNITLIDISEKAVANLKEKFQSNPYVKLICDDFFQHQGSYNLILEQTFFCAIPPLRRKDYVIKMSELLNKDGRLVGVLFDRQFGNSFPPFGGSYGEYKEIFEPYFTIKIMELCNYSIPPRAGSELFVNMIKREKA